MKPEPAELLAVVSNLAGTTRTGSPPNSRILPLAHASPQATPVQLRSRCPALTVVIGFRRSPTFAKTSQVEKQSCRGTSLVEGAGLQAKLTPA
jgi:hypothetical protein